ELLRGPYPPEKYGEFILPMVLLRRFDAVLIDTKEEILEQYEKYKDLPETSCDEVLSRVSKQYFYNTSQFDFNKLLCDKNNIADNLYDYIDGFSSSVREVFNNFNLKSNIDKMAENNLLYIVVQRFNEINLQPSVVSNNEMGYIFEELVQRFSKHIEVGAHYTPREIIRL